MNDPNKFKRGKAKTSLLTGEQTLSSWKAIANYLGRTVRTVQRWEKTEELPVRRLQHDSGSSVYAFKHELDRWLGQKNLRVLDTETIQSTPEPAGSEANTDSGEVTEHIEQEPARGGIPLYVWVIVGFAVLALGVYSWLNRSPVSDVVFTPAAVSASVLTTKPGVERFPSLSPDGKQVVYVWENPEGQTDLFLRLVDADEYIQLTNNHSIEESPAWSPDGLSIAFIDRSGIAKRDLVVIPALGGQSRVLTSIDVPPVMDEARSLSTSLSWFPDGQWIAFNQFGGGSPDTTEIVAFSIETGEIVPLTDPADNVMDVAPAVSPDGKFLAFTRSTSAHVGNIFVAPVNLSSTTPMEPVKMPVATPWDTDPVWTLDGSELIFSGGRWPKASLWRMPADGSGEPFPFAGTGIGGHSPSIAVAQFSDRDLAIWRMVYASVELDNDIWTVSLETGEQQRFQGSSQRERFPNFAPDGSATLFLSDRSGYREIWSATSANEEPVQWTDLKSSYVWRPTWSPDSSLMAYTAEMDGKLQAYVQDRPLGGRRLMTPDDAADEDLAWSLDGELLYTTSPDRHPEGRGIWALSMSAEPPRFISLTPGRPLGESPDKNKLFVHVPEEGTGGLAVVDMPSGQVERLNLQPARRHGFVSGPDGIYFVAVTDAGPAIHKWLFETGDEVQVIALDQEPEIGLSVDSEGENVVLAFVNILRGDLMLAEGLR